MSDPRDELAAKLVLALRRALPNGVTVMRDHEGYRVVSADGQLAVTVFADGSTSELQPTQRERVVDADPTGQRAAFWDAALLRAAAPSRFR